MPQVSYTETYKDRTWRVFSIKTDLGLRWAFELENGYVSQFPFPTPDMALECAERAHYRAGLPDRG